MSVQRYLTATSLKEAQRALWLKFWLLIPVFIVFYLTGLVLYAFYQTHGDPLAAGHITKSDQILPYFVVTELPAGLPGLLIAAIYSGTMSATSSGINALTTATLVDFRQRLSHKPSFGGAPAQARPAAHLGLRRPGDRAGLWGQQAGHADRGQQQGHRAGRRPAARTFPVRHARQASHPLGRRLRLGGGCCAVIPVCFYSKTSFLWYGVVGCAVTFVVGWLASLLLSFLHPATVTAPALQSPQAESAPTSQRTFGPPERR